MNNFTIELIESNMKISENNLDIELALKYGFVHILTSDNLTIQCCLEQRKDGKGFKKSINKYDSGINDGICSDVNALAFEKYGQEKCEKKLFTEMKKM